MTGAARLDGEAGVVAFAARPKPHASEGVTQAQGQAAAGSEGGNGGRPCGPPDPRHGLPPPGQPAGVRVWRARPDALAPPDLPSCSNALGCYRRSCREGTGRGARCSTRAVTETWLLGPQGRLVGSYVGSAAGVAADGRHIAPARPHGRPPR